ncbi:putative target of rapamycin (TOR) kinase 1 [Trypanosoma cruzi]|uniref:Putative target of rapamycin (TOR) kinase 1 n=1 Tax=Trypanosoma cruzi TaxID=5693 RepID=A0A2V2XC36_TRYCR|nr:putative target of rapamycin (TOR) kinase 1 [Trypanosoma cruzi]RNC46008.1 rab1 small GTP-binding protein [Trypanosoma cruzi]
MPRGGRHAGGTYTAPNALQASPEILQIITSAIAGVTTVVRLLWVAPPSVRADVRIDNIRIVGSKSGVTLWEDRESGAAHCNFLGVQFDHTRQAVSLSDKFVRSVCAMPALKYLTIAEMEVVTSRFLYAAAISGMRLCDYYFFIKAVRRRLSALHQGIVLETSPANLPPSEAGLGERLRQMIENNRKRNSKPTEKASAAIITDASLHGWDPFLFQTPATLKLPEGNGRRSLFYHAGRCLRGTLSLIGLFRHLAIHHGRLGGQHFAARSGE